MIECMAGKCASLLGEVYDASPFQFDENETAIDFYGNLLRASMVFFKNLLSYFLIQKY